MEVHAHSHTPRKKWSHYFWEFLMLFLAVFCGFLAEYQLEHKIEKDRGKQFILSYTEDLKKDIAQLDTRIMQREIQQLRMDSLTAILNSPDPDKYGSDAYFFARYLPRPYVFFNNGATMQQLKNAGNLRLIRNQSVVDTIMAYDQQFRFINYIQEREEQLVQRIFNHLNQIFESFVFDEMILNDIEFARPPGNPPLRSKDKLNIKNFISDIHYLKTVNKALIGNFKRLKDQAQSSLSFITKKYHLN